jgi:23S rRNA pseudouridine2605 synthase
LLAVRGVGSRRACDALIEAGSVRVNGAVVREPGRRVEPERDQVVVRGRPLPGRSALRYFVIHKPVGMITTLHDPEGRPTVRQLLPPGPRLFPVGRLDADTSGLLLVTNDGELAHKLMHPSYGVEKRYKVLLDRIPDSRQLARMREGVTLEPGVRSGPADVRLSRAHADRPTLDVRIHEGRYRQVRRMCEAVGLNVKALHRYGYGPLQIGLLPRGAARALSQAEVRRLQTITARPSRPAPPPRPSTSPGGRPGRTSLSQRPSTSSGSRPKRSSVGQRPTRSSRGRPERSSVGPRPRTSSRGRPQRSSMGQRPKRSGSRLSKRVSGQSSHRPPTRRHRSR